MKVASRWVAGLSSEEAEGVEKKVLANRDLLNILKKIIDEDIESIRRSRLDKKKYFMPAWAEYQAELNGEEQRLLAIRAILP